MAAFPVIQGTTNSAVTVGGTSHAVSLPASIVAGEKLIAIFACDAGETVDTPSGWTKAVDTASAQTRLAIYTRTASGSDSLTVTTSDVTESAHVSLRVVTNNDIEMSAVTGGSDVNPNPPTLVPTGGSQKYTWLSVAASGNFTVSNYPTNYSSNQVSSTASSFLAAIASYDNEATSENPGTFTLSSSSFWVAATIAIEEQDPVTGSTSVLDMTGSFPSGTISYGATGTSAVLTMTASMPDPGFATRPVPAWTNETRPTGVQSLLDAVWMDGNNAVFMDGNNQIYREESNITWTNESRP